MPDVLDEEQQAQGSTQPAEPWKDFQTGEEGPWTDFQAGKAATPVNTGPGGYQIEPLQTEPTTKSQKQVGSGLSPKADAALAGFQQFIEGEAEAGKNWLEHPFRSAQYVLGAATLPKGVENPPPESPKRTNPFKIEVGPGMRPALRPFGQAVANVGSGLIDPDTITQVLTGSELVKAVPALAEIPNVVGKAFVTQMGSQLPAEAAKVGEVLGSDASPEEKKTAVTEAVLQAGLTYLGAKGAGAEPKPPAGGARATIPPEIAAASKVLPRAAEATAEAIADRIAELENDPEVTGKRITGGRDEKGESQYDPVIINAVKEKELQDLRKQQAVNEMQANADAAARGEVAKPPTPGAPNAIHSEAEPILPNVRTPPGGGPRKVPVEGGVEEVGARGGETETPGAQPAPREVQVSPVHQEIAKIQAMTPDEQTAYFRANQSRADNAAYRLGRSVTTVEEVDALEKAYEDASAKSKASAKAGNFDEAIKLQTIAQNFREAHEAATGTGSAGDFLRKNDPNYKPPQPRFQQLGISAKLEAAKAGAQGPSKLAAAAVRTPEGKVETGPHHPGILERLGIKGFEKRESRNTEMFGFVDEQGKFLTRPEAAERAKQTGQQLEAFDVQEGQEQPHSDEVASPTEPGKSIAETKPSVSRKIPSYTRPPDVLDALEGTGKINIASARAIREGYNPPSAARKYFDFSNQSSGLDKVLQGVHQSPAGNFTSLADEEALLDAIDQAGPARVGMRGAQAQERKAVKVQQVQDSDFTASVVEGKGTTNPPVKLGNVVKKPGETFTFQGQKFTVASYDEANDEYILDDGTRFGRQKLSGEEMVHPDPTTPKLRAGEKGTGELLQGGDQPFNLAGESGTDADRIAAAKAKAEADAAEAKRTADQQQGNFTGMGGAVGAEFETSPNTPTSLKNAKVDEERAARGLPPAMQPLRRTFGEVWAKAMAHIDNDPAWLYGDKTSPGLIEELKRKPRALTDEEDAALLYHQVDLQNDYGKATRDLAQHFEDGNEGMVQAAKLRIAGLSDQLLDLYNIGKTSGTETARGLNARKMMAMEDFSLAKMELDKRAANGGRRLTDAESAEVAQMHARVAETQKAYDDYVAKTNARIADLEVKAALDRVKLEAQARMDPVIKRIVTRIGDVLHTQRDAALARIKARMKEGRSSANIDPQEFIDYSIVGASHLYDGALALADWSSKMVADFGDAIKPHLDTIFAESNKRFDEAVDAAAGKNKPRAAAAKKAVRDPAERAAGLTDQIAAKVKDGKRNQISMLVQRLARTFVERGVDDRDELIDRVHGVLSQIDPTMTRREAMDAISGYGQFKQLTKDAISVELRDLKGQMQQVAKLEDMQAGVPPSKTGLERRTPSAEESRLIKAVNEAKRQFQIPVDDPNTQLKSALDTLKTRLRNRTAELQQKIADGDFAPKQRRELKLDAEAMRLKAENERAKEEFRRNVMKDRLKQRTPYEKVADAWVKIRRAFILSSPTTLAKLTSAAVQRIAAIPTEDAIGSGLSAAFPSIARKAMVEGGTSTRAAAKALSEGLTKGMKDAWDVLRTGKSDLDVVFGKDKGYPKEWINFMGNLHGFLKAPVKRFAFEFAKEKQIGNYLKAGIDPTDPMVQLRIMQESYRWANRQIFQQDNRVVTSYKRFLSALDEPDKATGHVPLGRKVAGMTARTLLPIVKIPTNIVGETLEYSTGLVTGSARLARAYRAGVENLKPEEADLIMRQLKKGSIGGAVMLLGFFSPNSVGGYYQQGEKRKKGDVGVGQVRPFGHKIFGHDIPTFLLHNPLLETLQIGATIRRVADSKFKKRDKDTQGIGPGIMAGGLGLTEEVPFVREMTEVSKAFNPRERGQFTGELGRSLLVPQAVQWIAQHTDKDAKGNLIARKPKTAVQRVEEGIPGLRQNVPRNPKQPQP